MIFPFVALFFAIFSPIIDGEILQDRCKNVTVSEMDLSNYLKSIASTNQWDRPLINGLKPITVSVGLAITALAEVVCSSSYANLN